MRAFVVMTQLKIIVEGKASFPFDEHGEVIFSSFSVVLAMDMAVWI